MVAVDPGQRAGHVFNPNKPRRGRKRKPRLRATKEGYHPDSKLHRMANWYRPMDPQ